MDALIKLLNTMKFFFFNQPLEALQAKLVEINDTMQAIVQTAEAEDRDLTDDELDALEGHRAEFKNVQRRIAIHETLQNQGEEMTAGTGRQVAPPPPPRAQPQAVAQPAAPDRRPARQVIVDPQATPGNMGFRNMGEFAAAVHAAPSGLDPRLARNAPTTYGTEGVGADGGFAVPPDFRTEIMEKVAGEESLLGRVDQLTTSSNIMVLPKDETTPWQSTGGMLAYWEKEAGQLTQSKPALESTTYKTNKLTALVPITEELLEDAPSLDGYLRRKVPAKMDYKIQDGIVRGTGAGEPLGILNAGSLVEVAKETGQTADTVVYINIVKMFARMYAPCVPRAVWLINQDILPQLMQLEFPSGQNGTYPAWMPPGMLADAPNGTLMGRPVVPLQSCSTLGDKGDIIFADLTQYLAVIKAGGIRADVSMHLYFDYDLMAYRFIIRLTGQPWWGADITPAQSSNNLGCFVTLAERA